MGAWTGHLGNPQTLLWHSENGNYCNGKINTVLDAGFEAPEEIFLQGAGLEDGRGAFGNVPADTKHQEAKSESTAPNMMQATRPVSNFKAGDDRNRSRQESWTCGGTRYSHGSGVDPGWANNFSYCASFRDGEPVGMVKHLGVCVRLVVRGKGVVHQIKFRLDCHTAYKQTSRIAIVRSRINSIVSISAIQTNLSHERD
jgi:hypothetical protein